jgi:hypothetical protein
MLRHSITHFIIARQALAGEEDGAAEGEGHHPTKINRKIIHGH